EGGIRVSRCTVGLLLCLTVVIQLLFSEDYDCFFFQAEEGIRDWSVTGVQTCALPISGDVFPNDSGGLSHRWMARQRRFDLSELRSEERRVGKEGTLPGSPHSYRKTDAVRHTQSRRRCWLMSQRLDT